MLVSTHKAVFQVRCVTVLKRVLCGQELHTCRWNPSLLRGSLRGFVKRSVHGACACHRAASRAACVRRPPARVSRCSACAGSLAVAKAGGTSADLFQAGSLTRASNPPYPADRLLPASTPLLALEPANPPGHPLHRWSHPVQGARIRPGLRVPSPPPRGHPTRQSSGSPSPPLT